MSLSNSTENAILELIFKATTWANLADNTSTSPATTLTVALHTADPGDGGNMTTNECAYTSYARVTVARTGSGWVVTDNSVSPAASIDFPAATGGSETATYASIGTGVSNNIIVSGAISPTIAISDGVTPKLTTSTAFTLS
jgi:hypothetical protein